MNSVIKNQDFTLNERIAAIREKNARLENRHREIELDKKRAVENGSTILPSQIRITINRNSAQPNRNVVFNDANTKQTRNKRSGKPRGGDGNLSKSLSRLNQENCYIPHVHFAAYNNDYGHNTNRQRNNGNSNSNGRISANRGVFNNQLPAYPENGGRRVESYRFVGGRGKTQRNIAFQGNRVNNGPRSVQFIHYPPPGNNNQCYFANAPSHFYYQQPQHHYQQGKQQQQLQFPFPYQNHRSHPVIQIISPAKSLPSLTNQRSNPPRSGRQRGFQPPPRFLRGNNNGGGGGGGGGGGKGRGGGQRDLVIGHPAQQQQLPPPPPSSPPPSPSKPSRLQRGSEGGMWRRGNVIREEDTVFFRKDKSSQSKEEAISTRRASIQLPPAPSRQENGSPFVNPENDDVFDDDGYIDDNPLDDLDQYTLKIDMDGGFIVHDATICDPILAKPISSWIDDFSSDEDDGNNEEDADGQDINDAASDVLQDLQIFSNSSLTTSGVSTLSSLDLRAIVDEEFQVSILPRSFSADQLDKLSKPREADAFGAFSSSQPRCDCNSPFQQLK